MNPQFQPEVETVFAAALELPPSERTAFLVRECGSRPELLAEVESLLRAYESAGTFLEPDTPQPRAIGPYRIIDQIGVGGMGSVFRAERDDEQFRQQVAIKMISAGLVGRPEFVRRFLDERQILADLAHPNIARLLDGGYMPSGAPYLVMEYVDGVPVTTYCNEHDLALEARLHLFLELCNAVQFAHQHLVVHRDLKPGNVLVTSDGTPKLLDFGIAKLLVADKDRTSTMAQVVTLDYASPEQVRGEPVTTASDVYSLGVLLYELLARERPYSLSEQSLEQAVDYICTRDPAPPSAVANCRVSQDLDAIVMKAIRKEPRERYGSAAELSADIGRYLDGLTVRARRGTVRYVARKFIVRHRFAVAATAIAILLIAAGVISTLHQAQIAERRFNDVRTLAKSMIYELHDGIARLPGSTEVRKLLVTRALQYLDALGQESAGDTALQIELAGAYKRVGDVQGNSNLSNLGDSQGALTSYSKARQILESVKSRQPGRVDARKGLAEVYFDISQVQAFLRKYPEARETVGAAVKIWEECLRLAPTDEGAKLGIGSAYMMLAGTTDKFQRAIALNNHEKALRIFEGLLTAHPESGEAARRVALAHKNIAGVLLESGSWGEALEHLRTARELDEKRVAANPADGLAKLDLSFDFSEVGSTYSNMGRLPEALENFRKIVEVRRELVASDPRDTRAKERLMFGDLRVAEVLLRMGQAADSNAASRDAVMLGEALLDAHPEDNMARAYLAEAYARTGQTQKAANKLSACRYYRQALQKYRELEHRVPSWPEEREEAETVAREAAACEVSQQR